MESDCQLSRKPDASLSAENDQVECYVCFEDVERDNCVNLECGCAENLCKTCWDKWCDVHQRGVYPGGCPLCREGAAASPMVVHAHLLRRQLLGRAGVLSKLTRKQLRPWLEDCVKGFLADMRRRSAPPRMRSNAISSGVCVTSSTVQIAVPHHPAFMLEFTRPFTVLLKTCKPLSRRERIEAEGQEVEEETAGATVGAATAMEEEVAAASREMSMQEESRFPRPFIAFGEIFADIQECVHSMTRQI
eukprot:TRINITY_DN9558_c0_g1_i1.p1 TRINITY_DN9558_c0_g1~~TRINITY_DN9558_c0_g1_i1.p1  ORF type:complete len:247 (-),score=36.63 TRINITY_DN9558_c0_g1_i1:87-827(-)